MGMNEFLTKFLNGLKSLGADLLIVVIIFVVAKIILSIVSKITGNAMKKAEAMDDKVKGQELKTSLTVLHSANRYFVYVVVIILTLRIVGLGDEISGAIVAAGIGGLILSLGAQSIVKDMIAGLFLLFERQYYVGDYVKIGEYEGTVLSIALRVTYLDCLGKKVIIPNGEIKEVVNYSRTNSLAIVTIPTPYEADTRKVIDIIQKVVDKYYEENREILTDEKPVVPGIGNFNSSSVDITFRVKTKPLKHWQVERDLKLLIKEEFDRKKINIPYQQIVVTKN